MVEKAVVLLIWGCQDSGTSKPLSVCLSAFSPLVPPFPFVTPSFQKRQPRAYNATGCKISGKDSGGPILGHGSFLKWSMWPGKGGVGPWTGPAWPGDHDQGKGEWVVFLEIPPESCGWRENREGWLIPKATRQCRRTDWLHFVLPFGSEPKQSTLPGVTSLWHQTLPPSLLLFLGNDSFCLDVLVDFKSAIRFLNLWLLFSLSHIHSFAYLFPNPTNFNWILCAGGSAPLPLLWD